MGGGCAPPTQSMKSLTEAFYDQVELKKAKFQFLLICTIIGEPFEGEAGLLGGGGGKLPPCLPQ